MKVTIVLVTKQTGVRTLTTIGLFDELKVRTHLVDA